MFGIQDLSQQPLMANYIGCYSHIDMLKSSKDRGCNDSCLTETSFQLKKSGLGPSIALKTGLHYPQSREV